MPFQMLHFYFLFFFPFTLHAMQVDHIQELRMRFHGSPLLWGDLETCRDK